MPRIARSPSLPHRLRPVVQADRTGCALAAAAVLSRRTYRAVKTEAAALGLHVDDHRLWSSTAPLRRLLQRLGLRPARRPRPFAGWAALPPVALLAIKWHRTADGPAWHWVVFVRDAGGACVLDSKRALRTHRRRDFGRMKPKWFLPMAP